MRSNLSATAFFGSTGALGKLTIYGASGSILTDVAADMPNLRDTRVTPETPVLCRALINRGARIERETPVALNSPIARNVRVVTVVRA